jgi:hypothetical protein
MKKLKIISGGQTGADRGALEIAKKMGFETGGTAPKNFMTEDGPDLTLIDFGLVEYGVAGYPPRTRKNVAESDGTVIFEEVVSRGSRLTENLCISFKKPYKINPSVEDLVKFITSRKIGVLNVAGNRESVSPGINLHVQTILEKVLKTLEKLNNGEKETTSQ